MSANLDTAAPKGRNKPAQGKERSDAALGQASQNTSSPEGATQGGTLPVGWEWKSVGEMVDEMQYGTSAKTSEDSTGVPVLRMGNIKDGSLVLDSLKYLPANHEEFPALLLQDGDILFNRTNSAELVGKSAVYRGNPSPCSCASYLIRSRLRAGYVPEFLAYYINSTFGRAWVSSVVSQQVGQANVNGTKLKALTVPVPPLPEQRRVVAEIEKQFTRLEAGVAALRRVQANLKRYRAAVLKAACEGRLVPTEAAWKQTTLGEVSTVLAGYGFPERLQGRPTGDIGFFKVGDISGAWKRNEKVLTQANHYISKADLAELRARVLPTETVVFAKIGAAIALNRRAIIGEPSLVDNNVMGLHAGEQIHPRFLFHFLCTQKLDELARATTVPSIRKGDVEGIKLKLPPLAEQTRIVAEVERRLSVVEELESVVTANLQRATRLRQSILQKAFTGELTREATCKEGLQVQTNRR